MNHRSIVDRTAQANLPMIAMSLKCYFAVDIIKTMTIAYWTNTCILFWMQIMLDQFTRARQMCQMIKCAHFHAFWSDFWKKIQRIKSHEKGIASQINWTESGTRKKEKRSFFSNIERKSIEIIQSKCTDKWRNHPMPNFTPQYRNDAFVIVHQFVHFKKCNILQWRHMH